MSSPDFTLPQVRVHIDRTASSKLARTEKGRELMASDEVICDVVKLDPDDTDRIWIGTRRTSWAKDKNRTITCIIDAETFETLRQAKEMCMRHGDNTTLAAFGMRLYEGFFSGHNTVPFIQEPSE